MQRGQCKSHQRATHNHHRLRAGSKTGLLQQVADRGADSSPDITRLRQRFTGQGDDPLSQWLTINHCPFYGKRGADVLHQHANIGRTPAMRNFPAGEYPGQLFRTAGRVFGRDNTNNQVVIAG